MAERDKLLIFYSPKAGAHVLRRESTKEILGEFDSYRDAKDGARDYPGANVFHAGPGGIRPLAWTRRCEHCGQPLERPILR